MARIARVQPERKRKLYGPRARNTNDRATRIENWNADALAAKAFTPTKITGKNARYDWMRRIWTSTLKATARHVALETALSGDVDGSKIYPGVRILASRCNLSQRAVSASLQHLVRGGWLQREWRKRRSDDTGLVGAGFRYLLTAPTVLTQNQHVVLTGNQHRADSDSKRADSRSIEVLTPSQQTSSYQSKPRTRAVDALQKASPPVAGSYTKGVP
jgi:hypothetical protein